jgi:DNA-binding NarL/FixJ family response regulator
MTRLERDARARVIVELHQQGVNRKEIAYQLGMQVWNVGDILRRNGYTRKKLAEV